MADDTIEIEYELTKDDFFKFYEKQGQDITEESVEIPYGKILKNSCRFIAKTFAYVLAVVFFSRMLEKNGDFFESIYGIYLLLQVWWVWIFLLGILTLVFLQIALRYQKRYKERISILAKEKAEEVYEGYKQIGEPKVKVKLCEDNFTLDDGKMIRVANWNNMETINFVDGFFHMSFPQLQVYIPSRFFKSEEEKQRIFEQCQKWFLDAQGETANA